VRASRLCRDVGKQNELKDHLGNVRVVVGDRKNLNTDTNELSAHVVAYNNYYPFGMPQPGRNFDSQEYRYGFQGQEKDSEIKGEGLSVNYKYRMHDPRIGRFFAVDPLTSKYPYYTPYSFSGNKVIHAVELEGLEERIVNYFKNQNDNVVQITVDAQDLYIKIELVGIEHSGRYTKITEDDWKQIKQKVWESFSGERSAFGSGYDSYTLGMRNNTSEGFNGLNQGTLTISSDDNGNALYFDRTKVERQRVDWGLYWKAVKTFNWIHPVTDSNVEGSQKYTSTINNVHAAAGTVLAAPSMGATGLVGFGARSSVLGGLDDLTSEFNSNGNTVIQSTFGDKAGNGIKTGLNFFGVLGSIFDIRKIVKDSDIIYKTEETIPNIISGSLDAKSTIQNGIKTNENEEN